MLHTFQKDVRRLWWAGGLTLLLLGELARQDRWRGDALPGSMEGWLNVIVPFAWACLLGLVVEQDPLVGDRQFWITRPHRRASLLGAKLLFAGVFIHGASFLADCYILASRGFSPAHWLPQLLWKQAMLAAALTLPALALAALFRNFTQFMVAVLGAVGAIVIASGSYQYRPYLSLPIDAERTGLVVSIVCIAASAVIGLQYLRRKTMGARALGTVAAAVAIAAYSWLPTTTLWAARSKVRMSARVETNQIPLPPNPMGRVVNGEMILLPVSVSGIPPGQRHRLEQLELEIVGADGRPHEWRPPSFHANSLERSEFDSFFISSTDSVTWIAIRMNLKLYRNLDGGPVTIRGKEGVTLFRTGASATVPALGDSTIADGVRCAGTLREDGWHQTTVKFECESPGEVPRYTWVDLPVPGESSNLKRIQRLGDSSTFVPYVRETWLSPLDRRHTFVNLSVYKGGEFLEWVVPPETLAKATLKVTPEFVTGYSLVSFELKDARLADYTYRQSSSKP